MQQTSFHMYQKSKNFHSPKWLRPKPISPQVYLPFRSLSLRRVLRSKTSFQEVKSWIWKQNRYFQGQESKKLSAVRWILFFSYSRGSWFAIGAGARCCGNILRSKRRTFPHTAPWDHRALYFHEQINSFYCLKWFSFMNWKQCKNCWFRMA